jgi:hypothetical protein
MARQDKRNLLLMNRSARFLLIGLAMLLSGCRVSPLYIGSWGKTEMATAPGAVLRDSRGEPIMADLPPLGSNPANTHQRAALQSPPRL